MIGARLGDLKPGDEFVLPWGTGGTVLRLVGADVEVVLEGDAGVVERRTGREAILSAQRRVLRTSKRRQEVVH